MHTDNISYVHVHDKSDGKLYTYGGNDPDKEDVYDTKNDHDTAKNDNGDTNNDDDNNNDNGNNVATHMFTRTDTHMQHMHKHAAHAHPARTQMYIRKRLR